MELWDAYDRNLEKIEGMTLIRGEKIPEGVYHLVCDIIVRHTDGEYLLMQRDSRKHYGGMWEATAGGSALQGENPLDCAIRELREETGIRLKDYGLTPLPFRPYSEPGRDPRGRTITMVYYAVLETEELPEVQGQDDARRAAWFPLDSLPALAFDHGSIIQEFRQTLGL